MLHTSVGGTCSEKIHHFSFLLSRLHRIAIADLHVNTVLVGKSICGITFIFLAGSQWALEASSKQSPLPAVRLIVKWSLPTHIPPRKRTRHKAFGPYVATTARMFWKSGCLIDPFQPFRQPVLAPNISQQFL